MTTDVCKLLLDTRTAAADSLLVGAGQECSRLTMRTLLLVHPAGVDGQLVSLFVPALCSFHGAPDAVC
jgi:hypothetical protein